MSDLSEHDSEQWAARSHVDAEDAIAAFLVSPETEKRLAAALCVWQDGQHVPQCYFWEYHDLQAKHLLAAFRGS